MNIVDLTTEERREHELARFQTLQEVGHIFSEVELVRKDGNVLPVDLNAVILPNGKIYGSCRDLTERRAGEAAMRESEQRLREAQGVAHIGHWELDPQVGTPVWSDEIFHIFGLDPAKDEPTFTDHETYTHPDDWPLLEDAVATAVRDCTPFDITFRIVRPGGNIRWLHAIGKSKRAKTGEANLVFGTAQDVTDLRQTEAALRKQQAEYRMLVESAAEAIFVAQDGYLRFANQTTERLLGRSAEEIGTTPFIEWIHPDDRTSAVEQHMEMLAGECASSERRLRFLTGEGEMRWADVRAVRVEWEGRPATLNLANDITERKLAEDQLRASEDKYRGLVDNIAGIVFSIDPEGDLTFVSRQAQEMLGYESGEVLGMSVCAFVPEEDRERVTEAIRQGMAGRKVHHLLVPMMRRTGETLQFECSFTRLYEAGRLIGAQGTAIDISKRLEAEQRIQSALECTIQAVADTIETRDPYTAGHQRRVARIAVAIAQRMALADTQIEGIRVAATLHDIGKMSTPAEILSKPGRLSEQELALIQEHPKVAYSILKGIPFPWPVADIVLQHHERLDGSGYPQGLAAEDGILLEARILAVSDVVEAMASHRPYRPAVGIEAALEEIRSGRGTAFDCDVVDACVELLESGEFTLDDS